jgi:hypothetical protein
MQLIASRILNIKIVLELFVNGQIPSLIVEELTFNKFHHDSVPIK